MDFYGTGAYIMWINFLLIAGGLAICSITGYWTARPVRCDNPYWT